MQTATELLCRLLALSRDATTLEDLFTCLCTRIGAALIQGSAAAADPLEGQVPLVVDMISDGRI